MRLLFHVFFSIISGPSPVAAVLWRQKSVCFFGGQCCMWGESMSKWKVGLQSTLVRIVVFLCVLEMLIFAQRFWGKLKENSLSPKESPIVLTINVDWDPLGTMWRIKCHFQWFFVIMSQLFVGMCVYCTNKFGHVKSISSDKKTSAPIHDSCTQGIHILFMYHNTYVQPRG